MSQSRGPLGVTILPFQVPLLRFIWKDAGRRPEVCGRVQVEVGALSAVVLACVELGESQVKGGWQEVEIEVRVAGLEAH